MPIGVISTTMKLPCFIHVSFEVPTVNYNSIETHTTNWWQFPERHPYFSY
jgi:hypothetical protein